MAFMMSADHVMPCYVPSDTRQMPEVVLRAFFNNGRNLGSLVTRETFGLQWTFHAGRYWLMNRKCQVWRSK